MYMGLLLTMALLLIGVIMGIGIIPPLLAGLIIFAVLAVREGHSFRQVIGMLIRGAMKTRAMYMIMVLLGASSALWMAGGTIPLLIHYCIQWISPKFFLVSVFILVSVFSLLIGSSSGTAGTIGIVCMIMARAGGADPYMTAGAIITAAYIGERSTPLSSCANLLSTVTGTNLYGNLRRMASSTVEPMLLTIALYAILSLFYPVSADFQVMDQQLLAVYPLHWLAAVPVLAVIIPVILRFDVRVALGMSVATAWVAGMELQGFSIGELGRYAFQGFQPVSSNGLAGVIRGGGIISMIPAIGVVMISSAYGGILQETGVMQRLAGLAGELSRRAGVFAATFLTSLAGCCIGCSQTFAVIAAGQIMEALYEKEGRGREEMALDIGNTAVVMAALIPWNAGSALPAMILSVDAGFIPYAFFLYLVPAWMMVRMTNLEGRISLGIRRQL